MQNKQDVQTVRPEMLAERQRTTMLNALGSFQAYDVPEVAETILHQERTLFVRNSQLQAYLAQMRQQKSDSLVQSEEQQEDKKKHSVLMRLLAVWIWLMRPFDRLFQRVPVQLQVQAIESGAASLAMILSYYGRRTTISEINERYGISRDGFSVLDIAKIAKDNYLDVRIHTLKENNFQKISLPAIVQWQYNHFLLVERWSRETVALVDPASGRRSVTGKEFDDNFAGTVIILQPDEQFVRQKSTPRLTLGAYIYQYIRSAPFILGQLILATLLMQFFGLSIPFLTKVVVDQILPSESASDLQILGIGMIIALLARFVTMILRSSLLVYLQTRMDSIIMSRFLEHLLYLPLSFFQKRSSGDILSRLESNTVVRDTVSNHIVSSVLDGGCVLLYLIILFSLSPTLGFWLLLIEVVQTVVMVGSDRYMDGLNERELEETGKTQGYTSEVLSGIATLKAAGAEQRALRKWSHLFTAQIRSSIRRGYFSSAIESFTDVLQELTPIVILWIGAGQVLNGSLDLGTMLALSALAATFMTALTSLVKSVQEIQVVKSHLGRIADVMNAEREQDMQQVKSPPRLTGRIRLEQANFKYDESSERVLKNINVAIEPGQKIAIVGRSGSGKSTLGKLLLGLYTPTSGGVYYDEMSLQSLHYQEVRAQFGVVIQDVRIFSGTIRENIALNFPDITLEEITSSAVLADLHNDIMKMPMGYETYVSEGGNGLSGGQQQRLALARALAHRPAILLLDEATSALDVVTERQVERNLSTLSCTKIVITHRLSSIRDADRILVVDDGWLVEQGTHQNLLARNGFYANLLRQQLENGEIRGDI